MSATVPCEFCQKPVHENAKKCQHCHERLDSKPKSRLASFGKGIWMAGGAIVTFASMGTLGEVLDWWEIFWPRSKVSVVDASSDGSQFVFLFTNSGKRPATIGSIGQLVRYGEAVVDGADGHRSNQQLSDHDVTILYPKSQNVVELDPWFATLDERIEGATCELSFVVWNYGKIEPEGFSFSRPCTEELAEGGARVIWQRTPIETNDEFIDRFFYPKAEGS